MAALAIGLMALLFPFLIFRWFVFKAGKAKDLNTKAYNSYMASMLYLHQLGLKREGLTPLKFAETNVDPLFRTKLSYFIKAYEKLKYSRKQLYEDEYDLVNNHLPQFLKAVRNNLPLGKRFTAFLKINNTIEFFTRPNMLGSTKSMELWNSI
jgi:hypothetical protein